MFRIVFFERSNKITYIYFSYHSQFPLYSPARFVPPPVAPPPPLSAIATAASSLIFAAAATACLQNESANPLQLQQLLVLLVYKQNP